jgi:hypothetical protein
MDEGPLTMTKGVIKVFIDLWITTLPIPWVMQTQMRRRQRYLVAILFALGYVVTAAGAARVYYTWKVFFTNGDLSWWLYPTLITSTIENNLAIVSFLIPPTLIETNIFQRSVHAPPQFALYSPTSSAAPSAASKAGSPRPAHKKTWTPQTTPAMR